MKRYTYPSNRVFIKWFDYLYSENPKVQLFEIENDTREKDISNYANQNSFQILRIGYDEIKNTKNVWAFDVVYNPKETSFLSHFNKNKRIYGISMLIHQAAPCYKEWFGKKINLNQKNIQFLERAITKW